MQLCSYVYKKINCTCTASSEHFPNWVTTCHTNVGGDVSNFPSDIVMSLVGRRERLFKTTIGLIKGWSPPTTLEPGAAIGQEAGYTLGRSPVQHRDNYTCRLTINLSSMVGKIGKSKSTQKEPKHAQGEHAYSKQKAPIRDFNWEPSCCEATVLTLTPSCSPGMTH